MFDFSALAKNASADVPATLAELFKQLDRRTTHTSLRPAQVAALAALDSQLSERDVIMKLSTGSGKTVLGLVYAEMMRRRYRGEPVVYLCPTNQLVDQVVASGQAIGVPVSKFPKGGLPYGALSGDAVLACTYDKVFTANSVFESRSIRPSAIVMDDVHAGAERVRKFFTVEVPAGAFGPLLNLIRPLCDKSDAATWAGIVKGDAGSTYEVPYWVWSGVSGDVARLLASTKDEVPLKFTWDNIARYIELARCCVSGVGAEIALQIPPVEDVRAYAGARHRLFMSASIKDISGLISALACDPSAYARLIEPAEDEGAGERMILPTALINPAGQKHEIALACALLAKFTNVVVLTSSSAQAKTWTEAGATLAERNDVDAALERLRSTDHNYVVFAQRFDGVDLPDSACRILVVDGVPSGSRIIDHVDAYRQKDSPEFEVRTVNKFEQALGRAVRSSADFAAVLLVGADIAAFIGRKDVAALLEDRTRLQVELGRELANQAGSGDKPIAKIIAEMAHALLSRNEGWKDAHRARIKIPVKQLRSTNLTIHESTALAMREAWAMAKANNFQGAVTKMREASVAATHPTQKAEILYWVAAYLYRFDPSQAAEAYKAAFTANTRFPRPEQVADRKFARLNEQAAAVCLKFSPFASANAALARLDEVKAKLSFGNLAETVERGLQELGELLGADSSRPEKETGRGPDVLWLFDDCAVCIEAKNEKTAPIHKTDAAQLFLSAKWCEEHLPGSAQPATPVFATNVTVADRAEDITFAPRLLDETVLMDLLDRLRQVVLSLTYDGPLFTDAGTVGKKLAEQGLSGRAVLARMPVMKG